LILGTEDPIHSDVDQTQEGRLEPDVGFGPLELKEVEIPLLAIEVKAVDAIVVAAKRDLDNGPVSLDLGSPRARG
jgi:hypothetical protein